jgi:hypothetical protein
MVEPLAPIWSTASSAARTAWASLSLGRRTALASVTGAPAPKP